MFAFAQYNFSDENSLAFIKKNASAKHAFFRSVFLVVCNAQFD